MKKVNGHEIINLFEQWSPKRFAEDWDPVGLHIGQLNRQVEKVIITLDVNESVVNEAIDKGANLIIAHHPPIFRPMKHIWTDTPQGRLIEKCIKHDISVYAAHTNLDVAPGGVNDLLASRLGLQNTEVMEPTISDPLYKLAVFCPIEHADNLREVLARAGAGAIGDYTGCSFTSTGIGRFTPTTGADPFIGEVGKMEEVAEERIEVVLPGPLRSKVLKSMLAAHPYEEPAYDFFVLDQRTEEFGLGRVGTLPASMELKEFAEFVKDALDVPAVRIVGDFSKPVQKVAVLGGSGSKYLKAAKRSGADVFVTGDMDFHSAQDAELMDLAIVDPGHHVEKVMIEGVAQYMEQACREKGYAVSFIESEINTEPFRFV
ncbi:Nif3-like dinuclear metal center hexameric protein [Sporosarcina sp. ACRSL]|uniref:Nif3-like dinuclear metal center hexameric protein n=1 Tax=Sporosarcina sp. ACRSL TaxID=2918215 RepID=UPI001EF4DCFD|nr:Nif3-like dinuclear metal center hexameric protein [Sporosarcina sp. ACRSL]MCG7345114.1 Nif3-like dinuclear metal center hexameric protein [Sporosarcina sp. ACRSL]